MFGHGCRRDVQYPKSYELTYDVGAKSSPLESQSIRLDHRSGSTQTVQRDAVILVHGLFAGRRSMAKIEQSLALQDFEVINWGYPTFLRSTAELAQRLRSTIQAIENDNSIRHIHFVTHSMGGIIARCAIHNLRFKKIQRLVMLAPPNGGSHLTRLGLRQISWCIPALRDLKESPTSLPKQLETPEGIEIGIIAAARDLIVRVSNTFLPQQREHCVVQASHFELPFHEGVLVKAQRFLSTGSFRQLALS